MKKILLAFLFMTALPALAQSIVFSGCNDRQGKPVAAIADDNLLSVAQVGVDVGTTVIRYNPKVLPRLLPESRLFVFAHECGRQFLGFPLEGERTAEQARQADCWALATLQHSRVINNVQMMASIEDDLTMVPTDWTLLPGPTRELKLASCSAAPAAKGSLQLPGAGPASEKWNACVQRCAAKLDSCGRAAGCQQTYDRCVTDCDG